jgi:Flp pilus assembly pilin Flp
MLVMVSVLWDVLLYRVERARRSDRGASAIEWAIIAAVSVVIASIIGAVIYNVVKSKGSALTNCANQQPGTSCDK